MTEYCNLGIYINHYKLYISTNANGSFLFYVDFVFPLSPTKRLKDFTIYMQDSGCLIRNRNCLHFASNNINTFFLVGFVVAHHFSFLCFCVCLSSLCLMLPVSRDCLLSLRFSRTLI